MARELNKILLLSRASVEPVKKSLCHIIIMTLTQSEGLRNEPIMSLPSTTACIRSAMATEKSP